MMFVRALALLLALSGSALAQSGQIPTGTVWGNSGASKAIASPATFTAMFDRAFGSTTGAVIARSAATWGLVSGTTTTVLHGNATGSPSFGSVVNADMAQSAASTLKGNATAGTANVSDFTVTGLTSKATPVGADELLLSDSAASNNFKKASVTALSGAILSGAVTSLNGQAGALTMIVVPQGRLTLQTLTPVMTSTQSSKTTIYYTAYAGNQIPIYDGTNMVPTAITGGEISVAITDTAKSPAAIGVSKVNDWFVWSDAGTIRIGHGPDWTSDTVRSAGTALVMANGIYLNNASITNGPAAARGTYVGTTRSNGSSQLDFILGGTASGGTAAFLGVWNAYNRVSIAAAVNDNGATYTYSSNTVRQARASAGNQITYVVGLAEDAIAASVNARTNTAAVGSSFSWMGFGLDSTTTFVVRAIAFTATAVIQTDTQSPAYNLTPSLGSHVISMNEQSDGANAATFNADNLNTLTALLRM